jgi:hypothetical protein
MNSILIILVNAEDDLPTIFEANHMMLGAWEIDRGSFSCAPETNRDG